MATIYSYKQNTDALGNSLASGGFSPSSVGLPGNASVVFVSPLSIDAKAALDQTMVDAGFDFDSEVVGSSSAEFVLLTGNATTPGLSPVGSAWLWYDSTLNALRASLNGGAAVTISTGGGGGSLQDAYDNGATITLVGATPVTLNKTAADSSNALDINVSDGTGSGVAVVLTGSATGPAAIFTGGNVGVATATPHSRLHVDGSFAMRVRSVNSNSVALATDAVISVDASGGDVTVTLPTAVGISGRTYYIKKTDSSFNSVYVQAFGAQTIDGLTTQELSVQYESMQIVSDGTGWLKI